MAGLKCVIALTVSFMVLSTPVQGFPSHPKGFPRRPGDATLQTLQIFSGCIAAGHTNGCCEGGLNACSVFTANGICYCDEGCHSVSGGCCPDISDIGCVATSCMSAGLSPGCCTGNCRISHGCYCDEVCLWFRDCCEDVPKKLNCQSQGIENLHVDTEGGVFRSLGKKSLFLDTVLTSQGQEETRPIQVYPMENEDYGRKMKWIVERLMAADIASYRRASSQFVERLMAADTASYRRASSQYTRPPGIGK